MTSAAVFPPPPEGFDPVAYAREAARAVGLPLSDSSLSEVAANLHRTAGFARLVSETPALAAELPAPVFRLREVEA